jgi:amino acid permease
MVENPQNTPATPALPPPAAPTAQDAEALRQKRLIIVGSSIFGIVILAIIVGIGLYLIQPNTDTAKWRDIVLIFMALESLIVGAALVVLIIQIASLINLLNNEVRPVLEATNETIATLRGTTQFLSENLVEPVMKLNSYVAGLQKMFDIFNIKK